MALAGIIHRVDRPEVRVQDAVNGFEIGNVVRNSVRQSYVVVGKRAPELRQRLQRGRNKVQVKPEVAIRLPGDSIGISQQGQPMTVHVTHAEGGVAAELVFYGEVSLLYIGTAEVGHKYQQGRCPPAPEGKLVRLLGKFTMGLVLPNPGPVPTRNCREMPLESVASETSSRSSWM